LDKGDWDYLYGNHNNDHLLIAYGKSTVFDENEELTLKEG